MEKDKVNKIDLMIRSGVIILSEDEITQLPFWKFCEGLMDLRMETGAIARKNGTREISVSIEDSSGKKITKRFKIYPGRYHHDNKKSGTITVVTPGKFQTNLRSNFRSAKDWDHAIYKIAKFYTDSACATYLDSSEIISAFISLYSEKKRKMNHNQLSRFNYFRMEIKNPILRKKIVGYIRDCLNSGIEISESKHLKENPYLLWKFIEDEESAMNLSKIIGCDMRKFPDLLRVLQIGEI